MHQVFRQPIPFPTIRRVTKRTRIPVGISAQTLPRSIGNRYPLLGGNRVPMDTEHMEKLLPIGISG